MAIIRRGKLKGKKVTLLQWCNDWITVEEYPEKIFSPTSFRFRPDEFTEILEKPCGLLLTWYEPTEDLTFKKRKFK